MLDGGGDQASGLRRLFARRALRVLPLASEAADTSARVLVVNLAAALARTGWTPLVIDGHRDGVAAHLAIPARLELADLIDGNHRFGAVALRSEEGFSVLPAARGLGQIARDPAAADATFGALASLSERFDIALVHANGATLGALLGQRAAETALVCGAEDLDLTATYSQLKALVRRHGLTRFRVLFDGDVDPQKIAARHRRLAGAAQKFLAAVVEYGGAIAPGEELGQAARARASVFSVAAQGLPARAFERIAGAARHWHLQAYEAAGATIH